MERRQALLAGQKGAAAGALEDALGTARAQLSAGLYFEAHDTLEERWHEIPDGDLRRAVQGLIQLCAGLHKHANGQASGARYLLGRGLTKVRECGTALPEGAAAPFEQAALKVFALWSEGA